MHIGIDARMYRAGLGIGRYIEKIINTLEQQDTLHHFVIFMTRENWHMYTPTHSNVRKVCVNVRWYGILEQIIVPILLMRERIDLMHFPHFNVPIFYPRRYIVTIHDCIMIKRPASSRSAVTTRNPLIYRLKYCAFRFLLACAVRRARLVITVSQSVKEDLIRYLGISQEKIEVIYEAADMPVTANAHCELPLDISRRPFFMYAGNAYPHKNLEVLLDAFRSIRSDYPDYQLILCGQDDYFRKKLLAIIAEKKMEASVRHLGMVTDSCLSYLYTHATAFVFPSLDEGFGLPALEAFSHGCPVIASDIPVFREICDGAAYLVDTRRSESLAVALKMLIDDSSMRNTYIQRGLHRCADFSWERAARQTLACYERFF